MSNTIALVDDDRNLLTSISIALEREGFKVQTCIDGDSALIGLTRNPPDLAILDPDLTLGLPAGTTAATGIAAMVHAIEAYTTKIKKNPISDSLAKKALSLLGSNIRIVVNDPKSRAARENRLLGSMLAGMAFANAPCAAVHALAYPIGAKFHVPHGLSNSLVLSKPIPNLSVFFPVDILSIC